MNYGDISSNGYVNGICAKGKKVVNCVNYGELISLKDMSVAGIGTPTNIYNSYNLGSVTTSMVQYSAVSGGIYGYEENGLKYGGRLHIVNCYNAGVISSKWSNGSIMAWIRFIDGSYDRVINHCFYEEGKGGNQYIATSYSDVYIKSKSFIDELNNYIISNDDGIDTKGWAKWASGLDGYPILDFKNTWDGTKWSEE